MDIWDYVYSTVAELSKGFDHLGGMASKRFNINEDGPEFVSIILRLLWMSEEDFGFDPTITKQNGHQILEIERNSQTERIVLEKLIARTDCKMGRATTCWKAHSEADPGVPLVVKDSWQSTERDEEGELLRQRSGQCRTLHQHLTVSVRGKIDDVQGLVRCDPDIKTAKDYWPRQLAILTVAERSESHRDTFLPPKEHSCSASNTNAHTAALTNRFHRRIIACDYGKPIYRASSHIALIATLEDCVTGHQYLPTAGILHRDISTHALKVNEDETLKESFVVIIFD
ncbi:hypothetical protein N7454_001218 [Penicillium verhagenii]|nr:hypothetical protein N7454_001218 [Penicillium verhagenii]